MSVSVHEIMWGIRDDEELDITEKGILYILITCIGKNKTCWYSLEKLSKKCGLSSRRLTDRLKNLEKKKYIYIFRPVHNTHENPNKYSLNYEKILSKIEQKSHDESSGDFCKSHDESSKVAGRFVQSRMTNRPKSHDESSGKDIKEDKHKDKKEESASRPRFSERGAAPDENKSNDDVLMEKQRLEKREHDRQTANFYMGKIMNNLGMKR